MSEWRELCRCVAAENRKLRASAIWAAFVIVPLLSAGYGTFNYMGNIDVLQSAWYSLWEQHTLFYALLFYAPLVGLYAGFLWRMEHVGRNLNLLMTAPVRPLYLVLAKLIAVTKMMLLTQLWVFALYTVCGKAIAHLPGWPPMETVLWLLRGIVAGETVIVLQLFLSLVIRSFPVPVFLALFGGVIGVLSQSWGFGIVWPYALMLMGMNASKTQDVLAGGMAPFALSCGAYFALFIVLANLRLTRADIA